MLYINKLSFFFLFSLVFSSQLFLELSFGEAKIKVTRDTQGIWSIQGSKEADLYEIYYHVGKLIAEDRLFQLELYRRTASGTLSEVFGKGYLNIDIQKRLQYYTPAELEFYFNQLSYESKKIIQGYVQGINEVIKETIYGRRKVPFEFLQLGIKPKKWSVYDVLLWGAELQKNYDSSSFASQIRNLSAIQKLKKDHPKDYLKMFSDLYGLNDPQAVTYIQNYLSLKVKKEPVISKEWFSQFPNVKKASEELEILEKERIEKLTEINAYAKMGSYAWAVSGKKSKSGNPMLLAGPEMGHSVPSPVLEGEIQAGSLSIKGMLVPGAPGMIIGRTHFHAWSLQVGHAQTWDTYFEDVRNVFLDRKEVIFIKNEEPYTLQVYKSKHGPVIYPLHFDKSTYDPNKDEPILTFKYAHKGYDLNFTQFLYEANTAQSKIEFAKAIELVAASQHLIYINKNGDVSYWMTGRDPIREKHYDPRFPQPIENPIEWDASFLRTRSHELNPTKSYFSGWNNKSSSDYFLTTHLYGVFHRANVIDHFLKTRDKVSFEELKFLAKYIYTKGDDLWRLISLPINKILKDYPDENIRKHLNLLNNWNGHNVSGGEYEWINSTDLADEYIFFNSFINNLLNSIFKDELGIGCCASQVNVLVRLLNPGDGLKVQYPWFKNKTDPTQPQNIQEHIYVSFKKTVEAFQPLPRPWGRGQRSKIIFNHPLIGNVAEIPSGARSTYAQVVEYSKTNGLIRAESLFAPGQSGLIEMQSDGAPKLSPHFLDMLNFYKNFDFRK